MTLIPNIESYHNHIFQVKFSQAHINPYSIFSLPLLSIILRLDANYPTVLGQKQGNLYQPILPHHQPQILELRHDPLIGIS